MPYCPYHCNPDNLLREAERRARQTGDPADIARWVTERLRAGDLDPNIVQTLAQAGHPIAALVVGASYSVEVTQSLLEVSAGEAIKYCLVNIMQRMLDSSSILPPSQMLTRAALEGTITQLTDRPYHPHMIPQILERLPRIDAQSHLNMITFALHILWDINPKFVVENKNFPELNDVFTFLGHAHPEGRLPAVLELGNPLLGIS